MGIDLSGMLTLGQDQTYQQQQAQQQQQAADEQQSSQAEQQQYVDQSSNNVLPIDQQYSQEQQYVDQSQTNVMSLDQVFSQSQNIQLASGNELNQIGPSLKYAFENTENVQSSDQSSLSSQQQSTNSGEGEEFSNYDGQDCWFPLCIVYPMCCHGTQDFVSECVAKCELGYQQDADISAICTRGECQAEVQTLSQDSIMISPYDQEQQAAGSSILHDLHNYVLAPSTPYDTQPTQSIFTQAQEQSPDYGNTDPLYDGSTSQETTTYTDPYYKAAIQPESAILSDQDDTYQTQSPSPAVSISPIEETSPPPPTDSNYGYNYGSESPAYGDAGGQEEGQEGQGSPPPPPSPYWWQSSPDANSSTKGSYVSTYQQTLSPVPVAESTIGEAECQGEGCATTNVLPVAEDLSLPPPPLSPQAVAPTPPSPTPLPEVLDESSQPVTQSSVFFISSEASYGDEAGTNDQYGANEGTDEQQGTNSTQDTNYTYEGSQQQQQYP